MATWRFRSFLYFRIPTRRPLLRRIFTRPQPRPRLNGSNRHPLPFIFRWCRDCSWLCSRSNTWSHNSGCSFSPRIPGRNLLSKHPSSLWDEKKKSNLGRSFNRLSNTTRRNLHSVVFPKSRRKHPRHSTRNHSRILLLHRCSRPSPRKPQVQIPHHRRFRGFRNLNNVNNQYHNRRS